MENLDTFSITEYDPILSRYAMYKDLSRTEAANRLLRPRYNDPDGPNPNGAYLSITSVIILSFPAKFNGDFHFRFLYFLSFLYVYMDDLYLLRLIPHYVYFIDEKIKPRKLKIFLFTNTHFELGYETVLKTRWAMLMASGFRDFKFLSYGEGYYGHDYAENVKKYKSCLTYRAAKVSKGHNFGKRSEHDLFDLLEVLLTTLSQEKDFGLRRVQDYISARQEVPSLVPLTRTCMIHNEKKFFYFNLKGVDKTPV